MKRIAFLILSLICVLSFISCTNNTEIDDLKNRLSALESENAQLKSTPEPTIVPTPTPSPTPKPYTNEEKIAAHGILALMKELKNPESLQIHGISYWNEVDSKDLHIDIDVSAQNGFGGMNRKTYVVMTSDKYAALGWTDYLLGVTVYESPSGGVGDELYPKLDIQRVMEIVNNPAN